MVNFLVVKKIQTVHWVTNFFFLIQEKNEPTVTAIKTEPKLKRKKKEK